MPVSVNEVIRQVVMNSPFKEYIDSVKKEIYSELEKLQDEHYFWKWCKDNWEMFDTYSVTKNCVSTEPGKSAIYGGPNLSSGKLTLVITEDKSAKIFLETNRGF